MTKPIAVIGLGNPLMADEGIGIALVNRLAELAAQGKAPTDQVEYVDGGCGGMSLLTLLEDRKTVILIDCAKMGLPAGTIRRFTPHDVQSVKRLAHLSLHEVDILKVIELADLIGKKPDNIIILGIEPHTIQQQSYLSEPLARRMDDYVQLLIQTLSEWTTPPRD